MILKFHPDLHYLFGEQITIEASTPLDALKLVATQHPLNNKMEPVPVRIKQLLELELAADNTLSGSERIYDIVPAWEESRLALNTYSGSGGDNGWTNIIIGVVLIVVAIVAPYAAGGLYGAAGSAAFSAGTFGAYAAAAAFSIGVSLVLTGMMQLLAPTPKEEELEGNKSSRVFNNKTTTEVGTPIQIIFGRHLVAFHLFSFNIDARAYNGIDQPIDSPYFKGKADEALPHINMDKFYGYLKAGDKVLLNQVNNETYRTGREF